MASQLVLLGTGTPNADPDRFGPAVAIVAGDAPYLVDFGPGVVRRCAAARQAGVEALDVARLTRAFVTHLHSDHTAGYADLMLTPWVLGRREPLEVYGPPGLADMTRHLLAAYEADRDIRISGPEPTEAEGSEVLATEITPGKCYEDDHVRVTAFAVRHGDCPHAMGYRFETNDRVIVLSGDTAPTPDLADHYKGCDILLHEVYSQAGFDRLPEEWRRYHGRFHTSTRELASIARQVQPKLLVLYHQLFWGATPDDLLAEIRQDYDGEVVSGSDLDVL